MRPINITTRIEIKPDNSIQQSFSVLHRQYAKLSTSSQAGLIDASNLSQMRNQYSQADAYQNDPPNHFKSLAQKMSGTLPNIYSGN